ncbi:hypothetical protein FB567DRAFT_163394 [Paraphoma chrysanthemicola]|uniref:Uncharacterized protein n=1 Tax=Paraphoma chrysanthemicola TaxID=798071 RepID=A0A8K0W3V6_9PLEO|nr:hypothetical protein FB567DRAFT_163394 [Paraphoma chrysanthemicola]
MAVSDTSSTRELLPACVNGILLINAIADTSLKARHPLVRAVLSSLPLAYTMMIRHWAPTIRDGYAYHGRPQKPRRLIFTHCSCFKHQCRSNVADLQ